MIERVRFAVFYDAGNVYRNALKLGSDPEQESFYDNWGIGVRLNLPIGPLRFDFGIPIHSDSHNDRRKIQFGVGYSREF